MNRKNHGLSYIVPTINLGNGCGRVAEQQRGTHRRTPCGCNTQPFSGSFTRTDGTSGASGVAELSGSLLLASNTFYSQFTDAIPLTDLAKTLPGMRGSGLVRDLREAANDGVWERVA